MLEPIECIALRSVAAGETSVLLSAWSRSHGRITIAMPAGSSRESRRRRALTTPLAHFEAVADFRAGKDIIRVRDLVPLPTSPLLSPTRIVGASFMAEILDRLLRRSEADEALSDYLFAATSLYGSAGAAVARNYHIFFLAHLAAFLGIEPDLADGGTSAYFDMREGRVSPSIPLHSDYIGPDDMRTLKALARVPLRLCGCIGIERYHRRRAIDLILRYYELHLIELEGLKSLPILRQIFD